MGLMVMMMMMMMMMDESQAESTGVFCCRMDVLNQHLNAIHGFLNHQQGTTHHTRIC